MKNKNKEILKDLPNHFELLKRFKKGRQPTEDEFKFDSNDYQLFH